MSELSRTSFTANLQSKSFSGRIKVDQVSSTLTIMQTASLEQNMFFDLQIGLVASLFYNYQQIQTTHDTCSLAHTDTCVTYFLSLSSCFLACFLRRRLSSCSLRYLSSSTNLSHFDICCRSLTACCSRWSENKESTSVCCLS